MRILSLFRYSYSSPRLFALSIQLSVRLEHAMSPSNRKALSLHGPRASTRSHHSLELPYSFHKLLAKPPSFPCFSLYRNARNFTQVFNSSTSSSLKKPINTTSRGVSLFFSVGHSCLLCAFDSQDILAVSVHSGGEAQKLTRG